MRREVGGDHIFRVEELHDYSHLEDKMAMNCGISKEMNNREEGM